MLRRVLLLVIVAAAIVAGGPAVARIDHIRDLRDAGIKMTGTTEQNGTVSTTVIRQTSITTVGDKQQIEIKVGALTQISEDDQVRRVLIQTLYLRFTTEVSRSDLELIAAVPDSCGFEECAALEPDMIVKVADTAMSGKKSARKGFVAKKGRVKDVVEVADAGPPARPESFAEAREPDPVDRVDTATAADKGPAMAPSWWEEWLSPATILGATGTLIAGFTGWFAIQHQRHQMRRDALAEAAARAAVPHMQPLMEAQAAAAAKPKRSSGRIAKAAAPPSAASGPGMAGGAGAPRARRSRSRA